ncbi:MAG: YibE/F family protein [Oscillospiraceae bacterium]|nr:YibE/F family protein [Oscillospiraceae bacterium]
MKKRDNIIYILTIVFSLLFIFIGNKAANVNKIDYSLNYETGTPQKARVTRVIDPEYQKIVYNGFETDDKIILFEAEFLTGYRKGTVFTAIQSIDSMYAIDQRVVTPGDKVVVYLNQNHNAPDVKYMFAEYHRVDFIFLLYALFAVLLVVLGRRKGLNTLVSLSFTVASIFYVFIPAVLNGGNIYSWSISTCIFINVVPLLINNGASKKSLAAMIGCAAGVCVSGILTVLATEICHLTGLTTEDAMYLLFLNNENPIDLKAVIFAAIIFGAVGAVMDVSLSLSSSLAELKEQAGDMTARQLTRSGMVIGRDIMGTMTDTLILAYIGSSLSVTLLLAAYNASSPLLLFNTEMILVELLQAVAGSLGILLTIPLTSVICGILYRSDDNSKKKYVKE